jgi:serine/threonine protein kinase/Flp pilus assembly protein TadD
MGIDEKDVFVAALALTDAQEREAYLQAACAGHPELLGRLRELLSAHEESQGPLDRPPAVLGVTADAAHTEGPGTVIGPYKLIEQIGEGGMGTVWMAQQTAPVKRLVAVKLIKAGMDTRQVIARFEAERQALALMNHPNIALVLDAGTTGAGRPYFVMDLVKGVPITRYCDEHYLTPRERLELFIPVCQAIQHAHQKGIIHRDLKPSNVVVALYDGKPVPKVIDFGVAKAAGQALTEKTLVTGFGALVGTLEYMSPEQVERNQLDIDTRSDIYSLGVLLYELLAGSPPFSRKDLETAGVLEMLRVIREEEPTKPSTKLRTAEGLPTLAANRGTEPARLTKLVRGELDWIVMKALEKDRSRRYETANGLAADLRRYLDDEPVQACPPSARYRLGKFVRRNRAALATAALLTLALLAGTIVSTWQALRARSESARAVAAEKQVTKQLNETRAQRERANDRFRLAFQVVHELRDVFMMLRSTAGPERTSKIRRAVKEELLRYHHQLAEKNEDDPGIAYEVAESYFFLGGLYKPWGFKTYGSSLPADVERADWGLLKAVTLYERLAQERPDDTLVLGSLANALDFLGNRYAGTSEFDKAEATYRQSLDIFERVARTHPDHIDDWYLICNVADWYGNLLRIQGRSAEAEALNRRVLAWFERPEFDLNWFDSKGGSRAKGEGYDGFMALSDLLVRCGQPLKAIPILERARPHLVFDHDYNYYLSTLTNLCLKLTTDPDRAVRGRAVALARENVEFLSRTDSQTWLLLAIAQEQTGDLQGANDAFRRVIELGGDAGALNNIALRLVSDARFSKARPECAVQIAERAVKLAPKSANAHYNLGKARYAQGKVGEAVAECRKAIELDPKHADAVSGMVMLLATCPDPKLRDPRLAVEYARKWDELQPQSHRALKMLGWAQYGAGAWRESIEGLEKSCKLQAGGTGDSGQWIVLALAHARLAAQAGLLEREREHHKTEARRRYEEASKQIDQWWRVRPDNYEGQAIWDFREEARRLIGANGDKK